MLSSVITGGIGCGKSSVCILLSAFVGAGAKSFSADECTNTSLGTPEVIQLVLDLFGDDCVETVDGKRRINRNFLRKVVFSDVKAREKLESIIHPKVLGSLEDDREMARRMGCELFLAEVPLHYEVGSIVEADLIIVVAASRTMQTRRLMERRGLDDETIENILRSQWPIEAKVEKADFIIWNDGDFAALEAQVLTLARQFSLA